jgi:hypothetical protein
LVHEARPADEEEADPFSRALSTMMEFHPPEKPVKLGESWTSQIKGSGKARPVKIAYTATNVQKLGLATTVKVTFAYSETEGAKPVTAHGFFILDAGDGSLHRVDATVSNLRFEDVPVDTTRVRVERK